MHLGYAWRLAVRNYSVILLLALAGLVAAGGYTWLTGNYSTTTYLVVLPTKGAAGLRAVDPQRFFETQTRAILGEAILGEAVTALRDGTSVGQLRRDVQLSGGSSGDVVGLMVAGETAQSAQARQRAVLAAVNGHSFPDVTMTALWTSPLVAPPRAKSFATGLAGGAAVGVVLVLLWGAARRPVYHPRYLQLRRAVVTYPLVVDVERPDQVQQLMSWLDHPASHVVAVGETEAETRQIAAQVGLKESTGGPTLLVAAVGRATEQAVEEQAVLNQQTSAPVLVVVTSNGWSWADAVPLDPITDK